MPDIIQIELNNLREKCNAGFQNDLSWYAAIFAVKDSYEILVKYSCLTVASLGFNNGDDDIFKIFTDPECSMSLGDWTNDVLNAVKGSEFVKNDSILSSYFAGLSKLFHDTRIVSWRNDTLGHGVAKFVPDKEMIDDIIKKKDLIFAFTSSHSSAIEFFAECNDDKHYTERVPFIMWEDKGGTASGNKNALLFDSMDKTGRCKYLDVTSRGRVNRENSVFKDKRRKFHGNLNITDSESATDYGYDSSIDTMLAAFHQTTSYEKPAYLKDCIQTWLKNYPSVTFLIYSGRGTGKSSFVYACDELQHDKGEQKIKLLYNDKKVAVRAYYANRTEMLAPDEAERYIIETLETTSDDTHIRLRGIAINKFVKMPLAEKVAEYYKYYHKTGIDKLIIFIDGLDELNDTKADILRCIPNGADVVDGIYFICMCRSQEEGIPAIVSTYCNTISFTDIKSYNRTQENAVVLKDFLKRELNLTEADARQLSIKLDYRFSTVT